MEHPSKQEAVSKPVQVDAPPKKQKKPTPMDSRILRHLLQHPQHEQADIARELGLKENKVKNVLRKLRKEKWITGGVRIDPKALGYPERYRVDISILPLKLREMKRSAPRKGRDSRGREVYYKLGSQEELAYYILEIVSQESEFKTMVLVEDVRILLGGPADMSATIRARDNASMLHFILHGLRTCEVIQQTSTCLEQSYPESTIRRSE
jgi:DNA-binding Lrp family transcriptional regulator